ncbi:hypothetical protein [Acetobacter estunensis]|nr:hypothetical protein [Acetobacter estunensis]
MSFQLDVPRASDAQLAALFHNIMVDDEIDLSVLCPDDVSPRCTEEELQACYRLCWQLLERGVDLNAFRRLIVRIALTRSPDAEERAAFKKVRARFKHMRFACSNFDRRHRYPRQLHFITSIMGFLQDAFKNGQQLRTVWLAVVLRLALTRGPFAMIRHRLAAFQPTTPDEFMTFQKAETGKLAAALEGEKPITGRQFHALRKIISRRTAFVDTLRVVRPSVKLNALSLYLATINGLMGDMHDELILKQVRGEWDYHEGLFVLPDEISSRLRMLVSRSV